MSSNVNGVVRAVLNLLVFYEKISRAQTQRRSEGKAQKVQRRN